VEISILSNFSSIKYFLFELENLK